MTDTRLAEVMPRAVEALHGLARELDLNNEQLMAALAFLTEVGGADEFVLLSDVLGLSRLVDDQTHRGHLATASNVLGPFYRPGAPEVPNPGSIRGDAAGEPILLTGRVLDATGGTPLPGALVDVWQADGNGDYSNEAAAGDRWALRGRQRTDLEGRYAIETVRPAHYTVKDDGPVGRLLRELGRHPWRPAHIHLRVSAEGYHPLVTQAYISGGPYLDDDTIDGVKEELVVPVADGRIIFDVKLAAAP